MATTFELKIALGKLRAVALFVSADPTRMHICNVRVEWVPDWVLLVATDGRRLVVIREAYAGPAFEGWEFDPKLVVGRVDTWASGRVFNRLADEVGEDECATLIESGVVRVAWSEEDPDSLVGFRPYVGFGDRELQPFAVLVPRVRDRYPDWRKAAEIADAPEQAHAVVSVDGHLLAAFTAAAEAMGIGACLTVRQHGSRFPLRGESPGAEVLSVHLDTPDFYGMIMPVRLAEVSLDQRRGDGWWRLAAPTAQPVPEADFVAGEVAP